MEIDDRRRFRTIILAPLAGLAIACNPSAAGHPHDPLRELKTVNPAPTLNPEWLRTHGFREEEGQFLRSSIALKELSGVLGFSVEKLEAVPGMPPDELRATVELPGGRCTVDYHNPEGNMDDPRAVVDARIERFPGGDR